MELEATSPRLGIATVLLASITIGSLVAIGIAVSRPRGKARRLVSRIDRKMNDLESKLHLAVS